MRLKLSDLWAVLYLVTITSFLIFGTTTFVSLTKAFPFPMGFLKIALLGTFGECLKRRLASGSWIPDRLFLRAFIWGCFGILFTWMFPYSDGGVMTLIKQRLWPDGSGLWLAFSKSLWVNFIGGFLFSMMFVHYWLDIMLAQKKFCYPWNILARPENIRWGKIVILTMLLWWILAHTITFSLPPEWRVVCSGYLAITLGYILSLAATPKPENK